MIFSISEALGFNIVLIVFAIINIAICKSGKKTFIPLIIGTLFTAIALFGGVKQDIYRTGKYVLSNQRATEIIVAIIIITVTVIICLLAKNKASRNIGQQLSSKSSMAEGSNVNETSGTCMFCRKCGTKIPACSEFCKKCGTKIINY